MSLGSRHENKIWRVRDLLGRGGDDAQERQKEKEAG